MKVNTRGYQGKIIKSARVYTNDPRTRMMVLRLSATIKVPIYLSSRYVYFYGPQGKEQTRVVEIVAKESKPLDITPAHFTLADKLKYELREVQKGKRFRLKFTTKDLSPGGYHGFLKLKTNYQETPEITIRIRARIVKAGITRKGSTVVK